tara:strand:- start:247 stop:486 length:240 start_codon:yes stop_codon:yes gene_type:complete
MNKRELLAKQTDLVHQMNEAGVHLVDCGNCGSVMIHELSDEPQDITCPFCGFTSECCDFPDHFYEGFEQSAEFDNVNTD